MANLKDLVKSQAVPLEVAQLDPILMAAVESQAVQVDSAAVLEVVVTPESASVPPVVPVATVAPILVSKPFLPPWVFVVGGGILTVLIAGFGGSFNAPRQQQSNSGQQSTPTSTSDGRRIL